MLGRPFRISRAVRGALFCLITVLVTALGYVAWWRVHTVVPAERFRVYASFRSLTVPARTVTIYLPPGYGSNPARRYPVLYLQDGLRVFADARPFPLPTWEVDRTAERLIRMGEIEPLILVAIDSVPGHRDDEYTFWRDTSARTGGDGEAYARMLTQELKPFVDAHYRTRPGPADTAIGGSSLGGLFALTVGLRYPTVFGKVAALSPSVWWADDAVLRDVGARPGTAPRPMVYVSAGTSETRIAPGTRRLYDALTDQGGRSRGNVRFDLVPGAGHSESAWRDRVAPMLRFLFPARLTVKPSGGTL